MNLFMKRVLLRRLSKAINPNSCQWGVGYFLAKSLLSFRKPPRIKEMTKSNTFHLQTYILQHPLVQSKALLWMVAFSILVRYCVSTFPYSGKNIPPRYGDFEAQRHWLELTFGVPISQWYWYDSNYWGLDYPPLTAYHSYLLGWIAYFINPSWIELETSRGLESDDLVLFMRLSVLVSEILIYFPPLYLLYRDWVALKLPLESRTFVFVVLLLQPALILIDHGHFQYNCVMLGFTLWSLYFFQGKKWILGSISFCLAIMFKQMALYYSLPVFVYLLATCIQERKSGFQLLVKLAVTVFLTLIICLLPFLSKVQITQIVQRVFPLGRGLFEDKVANVWCAANVLIKIRTLFDVSKLARISAIVTLISSLPSLVHLFRNPTFLHFMYSLVSTSLAFFLFSFQVHEKSILLPLLPAMMLFVQEPVAVSFFINLAMFRFEGLVIPVIATTLLWNSFAYTFFFQYRYHNQNFLLDVVIKAFYVFLGCLHIAEMLIAPPQRYPHLYTVINVLVCAFGFMSLWFYFQWKQFCIESTTATNTHKANPPSSSLQTPNRLKKKKVT